jgi:hypothetical protein
LDTTAEEIAKHPDTRRVRVDELADLATRPRHALAVTASRTLREHTATGPPQPRSRHRRQMVGNRPAKLNKRGAGGVSKDAKCHRSPRSVFTKYIPDLATDNAKVTKAKRSAAHELHIKPLAVAERPPAHPSRIPGEQRGRQPRRLLPRCACG